jgi:hypothetical protein
MATEQLPRPGVSVIQQFRTVSPNIVTPTLVPCVVGPSFQLVEALVADATGNQVVNTEAVASVPAILVSSLSEPYLGLDGLTLRVSVNNGIAQEFTFSDPTAIGLTADQAKSQILSATVAPVGFTARTVERGANTYLQLETLSAGDGHELKILDGTANSILGFADNFTAYGISNYNQDEVFVGQLNFPDPRQNIEEIDIDEDSIRVFLNDGTSLIEAKQDEAFLRNGHLAWILGAVISFATASMAGKILELTLEKGGAEQAINFDGDFYAMEGTLVVPGAVYADPGTESISISKNADAAVTVTFASPVDIAAAVIAINAAWAGVYAGEDVCYRSLVDGTPDGAGTFIAFQVGGAVATGDVVKVIEGATGNAFADLGFVGGSGAMSSSLVWYINNALSATAEEPIAIDGGGNKLKLVSYDGYIAIGDGTANATLGLTEVTQYALQGVDDGDGDSQSALIRMHNENFTLDATSAQMIGTATLAANVYLHGMTFIVQLDGQAPQEIEFNGGPIVATNPVGAFPGTWNTEILNLEVNGNAVAVTFVNPADIDDVVDQINVAAGQPVVYKSDAAGVASPTGTYLSFQVGGAADAGGEVKLVYAASTAWANAGLTGTTDILQTNTQTEVVDAINDTMGVGFASIAANILYLDSVALGVESKIEVGAGTANATLGFTDNDVEYGRAFKPQPGDWVYADGTFLGAIVQVAPGAVSTDLRLDRKLTFATVLKKDWYIIAKNIVTPVPADRPTPNLVVDLAGDITVKHDLLRDTRGEPIPTASDPLLITYKALRLDVTAAADNPALLTFEGTDELETTLEPLTADNPLGLGLFFALINAPGITVSGLGVDAVSADAPGGTLTAYSKAMSFLESEEVYALAPLTHEAVVHQAFQTHANAMSEPDARGERVVLINPNMPDRYLDTLVASGTDGDTTGVTNEFDTKLSNLYSSLLAAGVDPTGTLTVADGVFLDIASDANIYSISAINGTRVTIRVAFAPGENDDAFYAVANLPTQLISENFSVKVRGARILDPNGDPDNQKIAETYADLGISYGDRRVVMTAPDQCGASIDGLEQLIPGYYMNAAIAGMVGQQPPQQGFTNFPMSGFTRVVGSNDRFSNTQLNIGAGGGVYWIIQEVENGPLTSRHQVTTDKTSIETREFSITKVVDFTAKFMRAGLRNFIGKFNITQGFLDTLSTVVQGQLTFLSEAGVLIGGDLNNIIQDTDQPDTVLIDVTLDVPYPCNYIRLTLVV